MAVGAIVLGLAPGQNVVDSWGFSHFRPVFPSTLLRGRRRSRASFPVTAGVSACWPPPPSGDATDGGRSPAWSGPALAVGLAELLKILVGRRFDDHVVLAVGDGGGGRRPW